MDHFVPNGRRRIIIMCLLIRKVSHTQRQVPTLPNELTSLLKSVDNILLVESAKNALTTRQRQQEVFQAVSSTGYTPKFALAFTHMDHASGENLGNAKDKKEQVFGGVRNVLDNQVAKNVSRDAARQLENHLQNNTFYFAYLDPKKYPTKDESKTAKFENNIGKQLDELTVSLASRTQPELKLPLSPKYSMHSLGIAVREGSQAFVESWEARLRVQTSLKLLQLRHGKASKRFLAVMLKVGFGMDSGYGQLTTSPQRCGMFCLNSSIRRWIGVDGQQQRGKECCDQSHKKRSRMRR